MLDPDLERILAAMHAVEGPLPAEVPVAQSRAAHVSETALLAGEGPALPGVEDTAFPGPGGDVPVRLYRPERASGTIVYFHGGGWVIGTPDSTDAVCRALALHSGATVASVDYRLAPEHPFPAAVGDALAAVAWAPDGPLVVAGDSAGGNLAAVAARRARERIALQVLIYPVCDAGLNTPSYGAFGTGHGLSVAGMQHFWNLYLGGADGLQPDASPLRAPDLAGLPPAYVLTAEEDVLRDEGEAYAHALQRAGVPVTLERRAGTIHGFWRWQTTAIARDAVRGVGAWVRSALDAG